MGQLSSTSHSASVEKKKSSLHVEWVLQSLFYSSGSKQYSRSNQVLLKGLLFQFEATLQSFVQALFSITSHLTFCVAAKSALCNLESVCVHHQIKLPWRAAAKVKCRPALQIEHLKTCSELPPATFCTRQDFQVFFKR